MSNIGSTQARQAMWDLCQQWRGTTDDWADAAAKEFEEHQVRSLESLGESTQQLAESVENAMAHLRAIVP